jgi:hypothetical protein
MKKHIGVLLVGLMLFTLAVPVAQSLIDASGKQIDSVEKPTWELNDQWNYLLSATLLLQGGEINGNVKITINPLTVVVEERTTELYQLGFHGDVNADIFLDIGLGLRGRLIDTEVAGHIILQRENLCLQNATLHIDGTLKLSIINVVINLDLVVSYSPALKIIDFPLFIGNQWQTNETQATYQGTLNIPGINSLLQLIFGNSDDEIPDQIPIDYNSTLDPEKNICSEIVSRNIGGGPYDCYKIDTTNKTLYYSPIFGTIVQYEPTGGNENLEFSLNLISTTYRIPGSPSIPSKPDGETQIEENVDYTYTTTSTDNELNDIYYYFDWGDGTNTGWIGPYPTGEIINQSHSWSEENTYTVRVKAKDDNDHETQWSEPLRVTLQKSKIWNHPIITWILTKITKLIETIQSYIT